MLLGYRQKYGFVPFVRSAFTATPGMGRDAFRSGADRQPVFLVEPDG